MPELQAERHKLQVPRAHSSPAVKVLDESSGPQGQRQHIQFASEPGVEIKGRLYIPPSPARKPAVLLVAGGVSRDWIFSPGALAGRKVSPGRGCVGHYTPSY